MRREIVNNDDYWMGMAFMLAAASNSDRPQGCIIVNSNNESIGMACDGSPKSMKDNTHVVHAEMNAIFNCKQPISGGTAYVTHTPCYHCIMSLIGANIKRIVYFSTNVIDRDAVNAIGCSYVHLEEFNGNLNWMRDYLKVLDIF